MKIKTFMVGVLETNCYVVMDTGSKDALVIDPGGNGNKISDFIEIEGLTLKCILLTHAHYDHILGCEQITSKFDVPIVICEGEEPVIESSIYNLSSKYRKDIILKYDRVLKDGESCNFGSLQFKVIHTPGHTPGSACYYFEKCDALFSGDTLFYASIGRTDFELGSTEQILESLKKLKSLPENTIVYPGHGQHTSIGFEIKYNPYLSEV